MTARVAATRRAIALAFMVCLSLSFGPQAVADDLHAHYLANAGVMIRQGGTTVLFDPLFRNDYGQYERVPAEVERALFEGKPPFEDIDAVFVSHYHGDHFDPAVMLAFLTARTDIRLYGPAQAISAIVSQGADDSVTARMTSVNLAYGDTPQSFDANDIHVDAVRIPHSGWPDRRTEIENIAWRVTLAGSATVLHLGDADPNGAHFNRHVAHWEAVTPDLALPPYWFFLSSNGRAIVDETLKPRHVIGVHVPKTIPDAPEERPIEFDGFDLFTAPGEERVLKAAEVMGSE